MKYSHVLAGLSIATSAACSSGNTSLTELPDTSLQVSLDIDDPSTVVEVGLWPDFWDLPAGSDCPVLGDSLRGAVNGVEMEVIDRGGARNEGDLSGDPSSCAGIQLEVDLGDERPDRLEIVVEDDSGSFEATFGSFFAPRSMSLVDPADEVVHPEQRVELEWTPASDHLRDPFEVSVLDAATMDLVFYVEVVGSAADMTLEFPHAVHFPDDLTGEREVLVVVGLGSYAASFAPGAERCVGPAECVGFLFPSGSALHPAPLRLTISP